VPKSTESINWLLWFHHPLQFEIDGMIIGLGNLTSVGFASPLTYPVDELVFGVMDNDVVVGDGSIDVTEIRFKLPNMSIIDKHAIQYKHRLRSVEDFILSHNNIDVILSPVEDFIKKEKALELSSGFIFLFNGTLTKKDGGSFSLQEVRDFSDCLNQFFSYLTDRRTSLMFIEGRFEGTTLWTDYLSDAIDPYYEVKSWTIGQDEPAIKDLWSPFFQY
jgi:hypothetical protein